MSELFLNIVNMSISASWIVIAVLLLRLVLKKAPKWITLLLWGIVAVRLVCPFSIESTISLIPSAETISPQMLLETPGINSGIPVINNVLNSVIQESTVSISPEKNINMLKFIVLILSKIWVVGVALMLAYAVISYLNLKRRIKTAVLFRENIYQSETVSSPFVFGIIKPKILIPFKMQEQDMEHVIAHEQAHIQRKDHLWKLLGYILLSIHWLNPVIWLSYILFCRDIEASCDEKVFGKLNRSQRADYMQALLSCSVNAKHSKRERIIHPLSFGEIGVRHRIRSLIRYKRPKLWIVIVSVILCVLLAVCFLTDPFTDTDITNSVYGVDRWYFDYVIGANRANNERTDYQIKIDNEGILYVYFDNDSDWSIEGKLESISDPTVWNMVREKLPFYYRHLKAKEVYAFCNPSYDLKLARVLIVTDNNLVFEATVPSFGEQGMYVNAVCKLKRKATIKENVPELSSARFDPMKADKGYPLI